MFTTLIVPLSILIPIFICGYNFKQAKTEDKLLLYYLIVSGLINLTGMILVKMRMHNLHLLHLYTAVEAVFILSYFKAIFKEFWVKKALSVIVVLFPVFCAINYFYFQTSGFNTNTRPLEAILITFFCMLYLYKSGFTENWLNKPTNWYNMGILIYFPVACIIFILSNYMVFKSMNRQMNSYVWILHAALVMLMYLFWARGFSLLRKKNG